MLFQQLTLTYGQNKIDQFLFTTTEGFERHAGRIFKIYRKIRSAVREVHFQFVSCDYVRIKCRVVIQIIF